MDMQDYWEDNYKVGSFGIKYLDRKLDGIAKSDLILIGARAGSGKTTIANQIYTENCGNGKCVLFSLENFSGDLYSHRVYQKYKDYACNYDLTQRQWLMSDFKKDYDSLERAEKEVQAELNGKYIITRQPQYTIEKLKRDMVKACEDGCNLLIIDHLDYVDKDNPSENDVSHITDLMRTIRGLQDSFKVAVVAVSHLRKPENSRVQIKIPNENEFIGSSNKAKEATIVIMFAPDDDGNVASVNDRLKRTWCCIRKNRFGGTDNKCANLLFNTEKGMYDDKYEIHSVNYLGTETKLLKTVFR
ncbi:MAG: AAA family ATPase [Methanobrevibacter sp.]|nr:AAA family ATPase [Methanobrevibacter sp.]